MVQVEHSPRTPSSQLALIKRCSIWSRLYTTKSRRSRGALDSTSHLNLRHPSGRDLVGSDFLVPGLRS